MSSPDSSIPQVFLTREQLDQVPRIAREVCALPPGEPRAVHLARHHPEILQALPTLCRLVCEASSHFDLARLDLLVRTAGCMRDGSIPERQGHIQAGSVIFDRPLDQDHDYSG
jgi:hypothetical protein